MPTNLTDPLFLHLQLNKTQRASAPPPVRMTVPVAEPAGPEVNQPLALVGAAITLPAGIHTREAFFEVIREKRQVRSPGRFV